MQKGLRTRGNILEGAAAVFNTRGFFGASLGDLVKATGLQKGGIYNHYPSKEALALAVFDRAIALYRERFAAVVRFEASASEALIAIAGSMLDIYADPVVAGGCVLLNTAVEADDAHPALRERAQTAMTEMLRFIGGHAKRGQSSGELRADIEASTVASMLIALCEGALMLSNLYGDAAYVERARTHVSAYVLTLQVRA